MKYYELEAISPGELMKAMLALLDGGKFLLRVNPKQLKVATTYMSATTTGNSIYSERFNTYIVADDEVKTAVLIRL